MLPVDTKEFWKVRMEEARKNGRIHFSVYVSRESLWKEILEAHTKILKRETDVTSRVLDAGCGYGRMAGLFMPSRYVGVDLSPDLLAEARKSFPSHTFMEENLARLPFRDGQFDVAFCISIRQMIIGNLGAEAWEPIERELKRVANKVLLLEYEEPDTYSIL